MSAIFSFVWDFGGIVATIFALFLVLGIVISIALVVYGIIDELVTRSRRKRYLAKNRPELGIASARSTKDEKKFVDIVEGFYDGV